MEDAYIVNAERTPFSKHSGSFRDTHSQEIAAKPLFAREKRNGFVGSHDTEDIIYGCVVSVNEQRLNALMRESFAIREFPIRSPPVFVW